jgi:hypothetical protein
MNHEAMNEAVGSGTDFVNSWDLGFEGWDFFGACVFGTWNFPGVWILALGASPERG